MANDGKTRSIKGETIDFDLMKIKQNIEDREKPKDVEMREKYIDIRRRRNPRRNVSDLVDEQQQNQEDARAKIKKSKENRLKKEAEETESKKEMVKDDFGDEDKEPNEMDETVSTTPRTSKKKIAKRKKDD